MVRLNVVKIIATVITAATFGIIPSSIEGRFDFRHLTDFSPLVVSIDRLSPPIAALEDMTMKARPVLKAAPLEAGKKHEPRIVNFEGLVISRADIIEEKPITSVQAPAPVEIMPVAAAIVWNDGAPGAVPSSLSGTRMISPALATAGSAFDPKDFEAGETVVIGGVVHKIGVQLAKQPRTFQEPLRVDMKNPAQPHITTGSRDIHELLANLWRQKGSVENNSGISTAGNDSQLPKGPVWVRGRLELAGGIAYMGAASEFRVFRYQGGQALEEAQVRAADGNFEIQLSEFTGVLRGELRTPDGALAGEGEIWLHDLDIAQAVKGNTKLLISAIEASGTGRVLNAYSKPIAGANVTVAGLALNTKSDEKGVFTLPPLDRRSTYAARAEAIGHWPTISFGAVTSKNDIVMYPDSMIQALWEIVGRDLRVTRAELERHGVIWGRVQQNGQPVVGAEAELLYSESIGPIYFNDAGIPETSLKSTGKNGEFVFLRVANGIGVLRTGRNGKYLAPKVIAAEERTVSFVPVAFTDAAGGEKKVVAEVHVFDPIQNKPVSSSLNFLGSEKTASADRGIGRMGYVKGQDPLLIEVQSRGDYLPVRFAGVRGRRSYDVPLFSNGWVEHFATAAQVNRYSDTGVIAGKVDGAAYQVYLDQSDSTTQVLYFDETGESVQKPVAGGGFLVFNCPTGLRSLTLVPANGSAAVNMILAVDNDTLSVVHHRF